MKDGWFFLGMLAAFCLGFVMAVGLSADIHRPDTDFADCVLEQRGTVQECAVKSGRWGQ